MLLKDDAQAYYSGALEAGEKLYPNTSTEGREVIRQELRSLRDQWETFTDGLSDTNRRLSSALTQWNGFEESYNQLMNWVKENELGVTSELELKNTLPEKKTMMQNYRVWPFF